MAPACPTPTYLPVRAPGRALPSTIALQRLATLWRYARAGPQRPFSRTALCLAAHPAPPPGAALAAPSPRAPRRARQALQTPPPASTDLQVAVRRRRRGLRAAALRCASPRPNTRDDTDSSKALEASMGRRAAALLLWRLGGCCCLARPLPRVCAHEDELHGPLRAPSCTHRQGVRRVVAHRQVLIRRLLDRLEGAGGRLGGAREAREPRDGEWVTAC